MLKAILNDEKDRIYLALTGGACVTLLMMGAVMASLSAVATGSTSAEDEVSVIVPAACTMGGSVGSAHNATLNPGTWSGASGSDYESGIGQTTLTVFCNDYNGFSIYAIGYTGNTYGGTNLVGSNTSTTIATGVYDSNNPGDSKWSMKVNKVTDTSAAFEPNNMTIQGNYDSWSAVPANYAKVAQYHATAGTSQTDSQDAQGAKGAKVTTTYAAYINSSQTADTYEGQVKYVMVHPYNYTAGSYTITYNANGGSGTTTGATALNFEEQTLAANGFTAPSGYKFAGWCTTNTAGQNVCDGQSFQPGDTLPSSYADAGASVTIYAYWEQIKTIANAGTMQNVGSKTEGGCPNTLTTGQVYELTDSRDQTTYHVTRLADGNCWMLDNLALDVVAKIDDMNETNTNASNTTLGYLKNGGGSTAFGDATYKYASAGVANWTPSYSYSTPLVNISNKDTVPSNAPTNGQGNNKVGGYYNYCAASAGSYCYGNGTSEGTSEGNATEDICPKGWRLPGGGSTVNLTATPPTGEYYNLYNGGFGYDTVTNYRNALSLPLSGYFSNGSPYDQGSYGHWWSSTRRNNGNMYSLNANTGNIDPAYYSYRYDGFSIRCVLGS